LDFSDPCTSGDDFHLDGSFYEDVSKKVNNKNVFKLVGYMCKCVHKNRLSASTDIKGAFDSSFCYSNMEQHI